MASSEIWGNIIVVDDSPTGRAWTRLCLEETGYQVREADSATEALAMIAAHPPDLILLDVILPDLNGFEVTRQLRADATLSDIPVILLTTYDDAQSKVRGLEAGASDFVTKQSDEAELLARVALHMRLRRNRERLRAEKGKIELLYRVSRELSAELDLDTLLLRILALTTEALDASEGSIVLVDEQGKALRAISSRQKQTTSIDGTVWSRVLHEGLAGWVIRHQKGTLVEDASEDTRWHAFEEAHAVTRSVLVAPLVYAERVSGVLTLTHHEPHHFTPSQLDLLESIAAQGAVVTEKAHLYQREQYQARQLRLINEVNQQVTSILDPGHLLREVTRLICQTFDYYYVDIALCKGEELIFHGSGHQKGGGTEAPVFHLPLSGPGITTWVARNGKPVLVPDVHQEPRAHFVAELPDTVSELAVPLRMGGEILGVLDVQSREYGRLTEEDIPLLEILASQVVVALKNARLYTETEKEREKLTAVLTSTDDAVVVTDNAGRALLVNPAAERALRVEAKRIVGQPLGSTIPGLTLPDRFPGNGQRLSHALEIPLFERIYYANISPVAGVGRVVVMQDITPLKELEQMHLQASQAERERLRRALECYVGPNLVDQVLAEDGELLERRERVEAVVLFADIRGFTTAAAALPPEAAVEVLNEYFAAMAQVIYRSEGTVIDFIGDELMASFGAPLQRPNATRRAVEAAIALQKEFAHLREDWSVRWHITVGLGVGVDRGLAVMGNIGTVDRVCFTLIGNVVNRAHRLVEQAGQREIIISGEVLDAIPEKQRSWKILRAVPRVSGGPLQAYCLQI